MFWILLPRLSSSTIIYSMRLNIMSVSRQPFRGGDCQKWGLLNYKANTIKWLLVLGSRVRKKYLLIIVLNKHLSKDH